MRKTLHDYVIERYDVANEEASMPLYYIGKYAELTNRQPKLGDFIPCDENGEVLEKPDIHSLDHSIAVALNHEYQQALDRVIFKGDWEVQKHKSALGEFIKIENKDGIILEFLANEEVYFNHKIVNRIEDLPLEIEFKKEVI